MKLDTSPTRVSLAESGHDQPADPPTSVGLVMSLPDTCREARAGRTTIYSEIKSGRLPALKLGRRTLIRRTDFEAWIASLPRVKQG